MPIHYNQTAKTGGKEQNLESNQRKTAPQMMENGNLNNCGIFLRNHAV